MKISKLFLNLSIQVLVFASLCACSRFIEGDVFLDRNGNHIKDSNESSIPGLRYLVTRDSATRESGLTDSSGHYWVPIGVEIGANYCVQVRTEDVAALKTLGTSSDGASSPSNKALEANPDATSEPCPLIFGQPDCSNKNCCEETQCAESDVCEAEEEEEEENACALDSDGKPDCSDKDCCGLSECKDVSTCKEETESDACPKDDGDQPICSDERCSGDAGCKTYTVKSMQACDQTKATSFALKLNVPVAMDYTTRIAQMTTADVPPVKLGDRFGIEISYPGSCTFDSLTLPKALMPVGLGDAFNPIPHELLLSRAIKAQPWQVIDRDVPPFGHDRLHTFVLKLQVMSTEGLSEGQATLQPTLTCPDGKKVSASANRITVESATTPEENPESQPSDE